MSTRYDLKLDVCVADTDGGRFALLILNFNIPYTLVCIDDQYLNILEDISNYLEQHFGLQQTVSFQTTATYVLRNTLTGEERVWTGSYFHAGPQKTILSGPNFYEFDRRTLRDVNLWCTTEENINRCLQWDDRETIWVFSEVVSIIVSCQTKVSAHHNYLITLDLLRDRPGEHGNRYATMPHPW